MPHIAPGYARRSCGGRGFCRVGVRHSSIAEGLYPTLHQPYPSLFFPILPYPALSYPILPYPTLPYSILPYHTLSYPILPYPPLSYPILAYPSLT